MKSLCRQLLLAFCLACQAAPAQTNPPPAAPAARVGERYLLLFDTSSAMKRRAQATEQAATELIASGMYGQLQPGDTIGVWTFNERVYAGLFPLQVWRPEDKEKIAAQLVSFLQSEKFQKKARFDAVMPSLAQVTANSQTITVILFSDGATLLQGTPFDADLNSVYAEYQRAVRKSRMPFITVLRAKQGRIFAATASVAPWPIEFPPYPPEPVASVAASKPTEPPTIGAAQPKKPAQTPLATAAAPIILDMSKPKQAETTLSPKADTVPAQPQTATQVPAVAAGLPAAEAKPVETPGVAPATSPILKAPAILPESGATPVSPTPAVPEIPKPAAVPAQPAGPVQSKEEFRTPSPAPAKPVTAAAQPPAAPRPRPELPAPKPAVKPESPLGPVQPAVTLPPEAVPAGRWTLLAACLLLTAAAILLVVLLLHRRPGGGASLITRSMERDKE